MGNICNKITLEVDKKIISQDIEIKTIDEKNSKLFDEIEKYLLLQHFQLENILSIFQQSINNNNGEISLFDFEMFFQQKIFNNYITLDIIYSKNQNIKKQIAKTFYSFLFDVFRNCLKTYFKKLSTEKRKWSEVHNKKHIPLKYFFPLFILYCKGRNDVKFDIIFDTFSYDKENLNLNEDFKFFIFSLFSLPTTCFLFSFNETIKKESLTDLENLFENSGNYFTDYEVQDSINTTETFLKELFQDKEKISYIEFKERIKNNQFLSSLVNPKSLRSFVNLYGIE